MGGNFQPHFWFTGAKGEIFMSDYKVASFQWLTEGMGAFRKTT